MYSSLIQTQTELYEKYELVVSEFIIETESKEYAACRFKLDGLQIISRSSKITPKKIGQFVTFWKRNQNGVIEPFHENDLIDFYAINIRTETKFGQFVFPKSVLIQKGIISTDKKEGKRGFRVYPNWDLVNNKQADKTQKWQLDYFYEINSSTKLTKVLNLYQLG